jgi:hypothetical protein
MEGKKERAILLGYYLVTVVVQLNKSSARMEAGSRLWDVNQSNKTTK